MSPTAIANRRCRCDAAPQAGFASLPGGVLITDAIPSTRRAVRASALAGTALAMVAATAISPPAQAWYPSAPGQMQDPVSLRAQQIEDQVKAPIPAISWESCDPELRLECATVRVPLDYDEPAGRTISLAVIRRLADRPATRIGSLFVNPGGPGGSAAQAVPGHTSYRSAQHAQAVRRLKSDRDEDMGSRLPRDI